MLHRRPYNCNKDNLVYIPYGAEKGDCPYCFTGVLRREEEVQNKFSCKEGYICAQCGVVFLEKQRRYFGKITSYQGIYKKKRF
jgi:hypothetical protein